MGVYENKAAICKDLYRLIKTLRFGNTLSDIVYHEDPYQDLETVTLVLSNGERRSVEVTYDAGIVMVSEIIKTLMEVIRG